MVQVPGPEKEQGSVRERAQQQGAAQRQPALLRGSDQADELRRPERQEVAAAAAQPH